MKVLILTGVYWPDTVSVAQHLSDLGDELAAAGHNVTVYTSRFAYDSDDVYPDKEQHNGINIVRLKNTSFGKDTIFGRVMDFMTFNLLILWKLIWLRRGEYDAMIGLTVPPLLSYFGVMFAKIKRTKFLFWAMDLQPELAIASGMMKKDALTARLMSYMGNYIVRHADRTITLDRYMSEHIIERGVAASKVSSVAIWPVMSEIYEGSRLENPFRIQNGFGDKLVIMYSGNHSYVHPLDTVLASILALRADPRFLFVSIGEGVRKKDVEDFAKTNQLDSIVRLPYQPRNMIHFSLGSADIQIVILGQEQVGYTHPNKVYGAMFVGKPILYIGPTPSHVTDMLAVCPGNISVSHGQSESLTAQLTAFANLTEAERDAIGQRNRAYAVAHFSPEVLKAQMLAAVVNM